MLCRLCTQREKKSFLGVLHYAIMYCNPYSQGFIWHISFMKAHQEMHDGRHKKKYNSSFQSLINKSPPLYQVSNKKKLEIYLWAIFQQLSGAEQSIPYLHICSLCHSICCWTVIDNSLKGFKIEGKAEYALTNKKKKEKSCSYWNTQPRRKKEQLIWKKLGYHGNLVNTKKTC